MVVVVDPGCGALQAVPTPVGHGGNAPIDVTTCSAFFRGPFCKKGPHSAQLCGGQGALHSACLFACPCLRALGSQYVGLFIAEFVPKGLQVTGHV